MERKFYCYFFIVLYLMHGLTGAACTLFIANDGRHIWIGNNEDESPDLNYRLWYYPQQGESYGYMIWTELSDEEKLNKIMYKNPQGGMNEYGLFMDYTAIDEIAAIRNPNKQDRPEEVVTDLLKRCKTVAAAVDYIAQFNLIGLTGAQLFIADADGDYAIIHANYCIRKTSKNFALTNYAVNDGHYEPCWRRDAAVKYLAEDRVYHLKDVASLLEKTMQRKPNDIITNYSMATDLRSRQIHLYYKGDFSRKVTIDLKEELNRAAHQQDMAAYFP